MIRKFRKLRMTQQALLTQGTIIILALIVISIIILPLILDGIWIMKKSSYDALLISNDARVSLISTNIKKLIDLAFLQANLTLNKGQQLYLNKINQSYQLTDSYQKNISQGIILAYLQLKSSENIDLTSNYFKKYGNLLFQIDSFLISFHLEQLSNLQVLYRVEKPHLTTAYSYLTLPLNFNLETRPYYQEHKQQKNARYIGDPFFNQQSSILSLMITQTLYDEYKNQDLVMGISFQFDTLNKYLSLKNIKLVLCTQEGIIITSNLHDTLQVQTITKKTFIFNQTLFPFTQDDWAQLNIYLQNNTYQSNCQQSFVKFCRRLSGNDIQIVATIIQSRFIQIIFNDLSFTKLEDQLLNNSIQILIDDISRKSYAFFITSFLVLVISTLMINRIIRPASYMINMIERQIQTSQDQLQDTNQEQLQRDNIFSKFQQSFGQLIDRHLNDRKSKIGLLNLQKYPSINRNVAFDNINFQELRNESLDKVKQENLQLSDKQQQIMRQNINLLDKIRKIIKDY
ncbi:hypothetical protein pb186bvf_015275 [Paramecium bursaria]